MISRMDTSVNARLTISGKWSAQPGAEWQENYERNFFFFCRSQYSQFTQNRCCHYAVFQFIMS